MADHFGGPTTSGEDHRPPSRTGRKVAIDLLHSVVEKVHDGGKKLRERLGGRRHVTDPIELAAKSVSRSRQKDLETLKAVPEKPQPGSVTSTTRVVPLAGGASTPGFVSNRVVTAKYNAVTFLPIYLYEMFSRLAYMYFLVQAALSWWPTISPFGGWGSTLALLFVLLVGAVKALWEDRKRHVEDKAMNRSTAHCLRPDGSVEDIQWTDVEVGQLLMVKDDELFPADLLCLYSALPAKVCFIKTTNLDGETNLKIKKPLDLRDVKLESHADIVGAKGSLDVEPPGPDLHHLKGTFNYFTDTGESKRTSVTMNEMLLRGCLLKNSGHVIGLVVYTGEESRIQKNAAKTPLKVGSFDRFLNVMILLVVMVQVIQCTLCAVANVIWKSSVGNHRYYMGFNYDSNGNYSNGFVYFVIMWLTFWLLYAYLVPISLFVTMEIVKFWQGFVFINSDKQMYDPISDERARCRNSALNEDLGKVEYVFSDKTGTLTSNEMQLRMVAVKNVPYGNPDWRVEEYDGPPGLEALQMWDHTMADSLKLLCGQPELLRSLLDNGGTPLHVLADERVHDPHGPPTVEMGMRTLDFWLNICICQSLIVEDDPKGKLPVYQGPSPDEVALVDAARKLGFEFKARTLNDITVEVLGQEVKYELLNLQEFTSARGCMSVVARSPDGTIRLYCKGADAKVLPRLRKVQNAELMEQVDVSLHLFATKGLRTLLLGTKIISEEDYADWDDRYQEAAADLDNRETGLDKLADEIEQGLELVGVTAIEDKLQDGVPDAIASLLDAGIRVWMITGDKQETAINIGISCKLVRNPDSLLICNGNTYDEARERLTLLFNKIADLEASAFREGGMAMVGELVIDGKTLGHVLETPLQEMLAEIGARCGSVVICRASPSQKAKIVKLMMDYELRVAAGTSTGLTRWWKRYNKRMKGKMLGIGDGANDVAMIQAADIGIGIMGKEGRQAVNNSDYAIAQFRFLVRLLLVHGTLSQYRLAKLIKYSFYKNVAFSFILFYFQFFSGYSGTTLIDGIPATFYNVVFTSLPIMFFSVLDRPVKYLTTLMRYPQLYNKQASLTIEAFLNSGLLVAIVDAAIIFFVPYFAISTNNSHQVSDVFSLGKVCFVTLVGVITLEIMLVSRFWTAPFVVVTLLSYVVVYIFAVIYPYLEYSVNIIDASWYGPAFEVLGSGYFWMSSLAIYSAAFGYRFMQRQILWTFNPHDTMILSEKELRYGPMGGPSSWQALARVKTLMEAQDDAGGYDGDGEDVAFEVSNGEHQDKVVLNQGFFAASHM